MTPAEQALSSSRQSVYGEWQPNMVATSENMTGLLRQYAANNTDSVALPDWWAPFMQVAVKLNRIASGRYHADNFQDLRVYLAFVEEMQRGTATGGTPADREVFQHCIDAAKMDAPVVRPDPIERIYIAGPYTASSSGTTPEHVRRAAEASIAVMRKGHDAHCPHTATFLPDLLSAGCMRYERWMRLDFGLIEHWATGILILAESPGTLRELQCAQSCGKRIYLSIDEIPDITGVTCGRQPV